MNSDETEAPEYSIAAQLGEPVDWNNPSERSHAPTKQYLQKALLPALSSGLRELVKEKPDNSLHWLGNYLIEHSKEN